MITSPAFRFLNFETGPRILREAVKLYGIKEYAGAQNNPHIMDWAGELGENIRKVYTGDSIPWCGLFMGIVAHRAGLEVVNNPLWALSWSAWGRPQNTAMLGDVLVFTRGKGGHVGLYVGEKSDVYYVLGGNQSDSVNITQIAKSRLYAIRRTPWRIAQPKNVRVIHIKRKHGTLSQNEA